jgi:hypothetical protein
MSAVTTGRGVSGILEDELEALIGTLKSDTGDSRWRLHMQLFHVSEYSLRVYAPDRHSQEHTVTMTSKIVQDIRDILVGEAKLWESRVRPVLTPADAAAID